MNAFDTVDSFERNFWIGNTELVAPITVAVCDEIDGPEGNFDFGDNVTNEAYLEQFRTEELVNLCIRVTAECLGENGTDFLGACHLRSGRDFESDVSSTVVDHGMVDTAIAELVTALQRKATDLKRAGL
jgi:hypothetical protein